uniref:uncharacterized protein LOC125906516 n=1 Tax=Anopheles coluzzii TaxID=1518534 RepID=UPI0020FFC8FE|nr:uncharacterized protein LOC125906516 [Anopheles coluzzii]
MSTSTGAALAALTCLKIPRCRSVKEIGDQVGFQAALNSAVAAIGKLVEPIVAEVRSGFALLQTASTPHNRNSDPRPATGRKRRRIIEDSTSPGVNKIVNSRGNILCAASSPNAYTNTTIGVQPAPTQPHELVGTDRYHHRFKLHLVSHSQIGSGSAYSAYQRPLLWNKWSLL